MVLIKCKYQFSLWYDSLVAGTILESGSVVEALVLDVAKADKLVELTLKPEFINRSKESSTSHTNKKVGIFFLLLTSYVCLHAYISHFGPTWQRKSWVNFLIHIICCRAMEPSLWNLSHCIVSFFSLINIPFFFLSEGKTVWIIFCCYDVMFKVSIMGIQFCL